MKNEIINNCSNNTNNQINNNKNEVKTMRKITNNTINFNANALNSSLIASAIGYAGNGRDGFLSGLVCDGNVANPPTWPSIRAWPSPLRVNSGCLARR